MATLVDINDPRTVMFKTNTDVKSGTLVDVFYNGHVYRCKVSNAKKHAYVFKSSDFPWAKLTGKYLEPWACGVHTIRSFVAHD